VATTLLHQQVII